MAGYFLTFGFHLPDFSAGNNTAMAAGYSLLATFAFGSSTVLSKKVLVIYSFSIATFYNYGTTALIMLVIVTLNGNLLSLPTVNRYE